MRSNFRFKSIPSMLGTLFLLFGVQASAQSATCDTTLTQNGKIDVSFTISTNLSTLDSLEVTHLWISTGDSTVVYYAAYSMEEDDVSGFQKWQINEQANTLNFSTGSFDPDQIHATIRLYHSTGIPEEYTFN